MEDSLLGPYEVELPYDPKTALQEKWKHTSRQKQVSNVYNSIIHNSQKTETMHINGWMDQ